MNLDLKKGFTTVLLVQDIFTRWLWAVQVSSNKEAAEQFKCLMAMHECQCRQLTTDQGTEFTSVAFSQLVQTNNMRHVRTVTLTDLNTIDRAMGLLKDRIAAVVADALQYACSGVLQGCGRQVHGGRVVLFSYYAIALPLVNVLSRASSICFRVGFSSRFTSFSRWRM